VKVAYRVDRVPDGWRYLSGTRRAADDREVIAGGT
jgi:hypothetical protein